jgi:hypothetical protein
MRASANRRKLGKLPNLATVYFHGRHPRFVQQSSGPLLGSIDPVFETRLLSRFLLATKPESAPQVAPDAGQGTHELLLSPWDGGAKNHVGAGVSTPGGPGFLLRGVTPAAHVVMSRSYRLRAGSASD